MKPNKLSSMLTFVLLLCTSVAWGQGNPQQYPSPSTPPTFPEGQQSPSTNPDQTPGQQQYPPSNPTQTNPAGQTGAPAMSPTQAQNQIQDALRKQLPASADSVVVNLLSDNRIQLNGTVSSDQERQRIEQVARSAAPDQIIVNSISVANPALPGTPPGSAKSEPPPSTTAQTGISNQNPDQSSGTQPGAAGQVYPPPATNETQPGTTGQSSTLPQSSGTAMTSPDVQNSIQTALANDPSLAKSSVAVNVTDSKVELTGTVSTRDEKRAAQRIAESNAGGRNVVNHIRIEKSKPSSGPTQ